MKRTSLHMGGLTLVGGFIVTCLMGARIGRAQQQPPSVVPQAFEVASIKVNKDTGPGARGGNCRGTDSPASTPPPAAPGGSGQPPAAVRGAGPGPAAIVGPPSVPIGRCVFTRVTLVNLIAAAYQLTGKGVLTNSIAGGPSWMMTEIFDINAKAEESTATIAQLRQMLKTLLADRFKLKFHNESRQGSPASTPSR